MEEMWFLNQHLTTPSPPALAMLSTSSTNPLLRICHSLEKIEKNLSVLPEMSIKLDNINNNLRLMIFGVVGGSVVSTISSYVAYNAFTRNVARRWFRHITFRSVEERPLDHVTSNLSYMSNLLSWTGFEFNGGGGGGGGGGLYSNCFSLVDLKVEEF
ncbi:hypothetical protein ACFE04_009171 [Oxalis oulophora]